MHHNDYPQVNQQENKEHPSAIQVMLRQIGLQQVIQYFSIQQIRDCLKNSKIMHQFLLSINSSELRHALIERQQKQEEERKQKQRQKRMRKAGLSLSNHQHEHENNLLMYNVLDFTIQQILKRCRDNSLLDFDDVKRYDKYNLQDHYILGMKLVENIPQKYYVGNKSHHFNHSKQLQQVYGIHKQSFNDEEQQSYDQQAKDDQQQYDQQLNNEQSINNQINNQENAFSSPNSENMQEFLNDQESLSNYEPSQSEDVDKKVHEMSSNQIKQWQKTRHTKITNKNKKITKGRNNIKLKPIKRAKQAQQIYEQQQQIQRFKIVQQTADKNEKKEVENIKNKKCTIDSDVQLQN